jgi:hypothetical protein
VIHFWRQSRSRYPIGFKLRWDLSTCSVTTTTAIKVDKAQTEVKGESDRNVGFYFAGAGFVFELSPFVIELLGHLSLQCIVCLKLCKGV